MPNSVLLTLDVPERTSSCGETLNISFRGDLLPKRSLSQHLPLRILPAMDMALNVPQNREGGWEGKLFKRKGN